MKKTINNNIPQTDRKQRSDCECSVSYWDDQWRDSAGEASEQPADVKHPHVLGRDDDGETKDERQWAEHQAKLPPDLLHHPAAQQAPYGCSHSDYRLNNKAFELIRRRLSNIGPLKMMSYPEPGGLVCVQLQSRVSDGSEFRDDGRAVPQNKPETHGAQDWRKSGQVQLLVLHFTEVRIGNTAGCKWERSGLVFTFAHLHNRLCFVKVEG